MRHRQVGIDTCRTHAILQSFELLTNGPKISYHERQKSTLSLSFSFFLFQYLYDVNHQYVFSSQLEPINSTVSVWDNRFLSISLTYHFIRVKHFFFAIKRKNKNWIEQKMQIIWGKTICVLVHCYILYFMKWLRSQNETCHKWR